MTDSLLTMEIEKEQESVKPDILPEKFWDGETGEIRLDDLIKSYIALEKKLSSIPAGRIPASPDDYCIRCDHGLFSPDADLNRRLHENGFSAEQVQMVYDLAAEKLVPMILELSGEFKADREVDRLVAAFGGVEKWAEVSRQLLAYGRRNLPADVLETLSSSFEGVMMLHRMMKGGDADVIDARNMADPAALNETDLKSMMRDPRYWRKKDPAFVSKVTDGFRQIYGKDA